MNLSRLYKCVYLLLLEVSVVFGYLGSPHNLTLDTLNTRYNLTWNWSGEAPVNETVTFTAQYIAQYKTRKPIHMQNWTSVCKNVVEQICEFTDTGLFYFGMFLLRVQASTSQQSSPWVQIEFCPDKHAAIGPPSSVKLNSIKNGIEIVIADPLDSANQSMKELVQNMNYLIQYWKKHEDVKKAEKLSSSINFVTLSGLEKWMWYCVRIQSRYEFYNKTSVYSDTQCTQTEGETTKLEKFLYFLLSMVLSFLLILVLLYVFYKVYRTIKNIFYPTVTLPFYIQEHRTSDSDMPKLLTPQSETFCKHLDIIRGEMNTVVEDDHILDEDQGIETHSKQDSGDSGFISTGEDSCHKSYSLTQKITHNIHIEDMCKMNHREELHGMQKLIV